MKPVIQSLWIGNSLSKIEQLCINSFLKNGHDFHLYTYNKVYGIPEGTTILDANEIIPEKRIFRYRNGSVACFANYFRYKLLYEKGNWWVDADVVCLKPFEFDSPYVFGFEEEDYRINNAVLKFPQHDGLLAELVQISASPNRINKQDGLKAKLKKALFKNLTNNKIAGLHWGETGPDLLSKLVSEHSLTDYAQDRAVFYPVHWTDWRKYFEPHPDDALFCKEQTVAIHIWHEMLRREVDKNAPFPKGSVLSRLEEKYG